MIHAAYESGAAVYDDDFPVITVVYLVGEVGEAYFQETAHFDAGFAHLLEEPGGDVPTAYVVVDDAHLDAGAGAFYQDVAHQAADGVVFEDVGFDVDVLSGALHFAQQGGEQCVAGGIGFHQVSVKRE